MKTKPQKIEYSLLSNANCQLTTLLRMFKEILK